MDKKAARRVLHRMASKARRGLDIRLATYQLCDLTEVIYISVSSPGKCSKYSTSLIGLL